ncbi:MAG: RlmE family RNA methyltransferase [Pseudomonadota bacterium]|nr:RlmE family RNA methyltransferase [Pseudomonadota bacterium]
MGYDRSDSWTRKAKAAGFPARSVFKLEEIDTRHHVVPAAGVAVDLGCFPGSWSKWLLGRGVRVVGVDLKAPDLPGGHWIVGSVMEVDAAALLEASGGRVDLVVSDLAQNTTGQRLVDHVRQIALADRALSLAIEIGRPGSNFVCKVFDGEDAGAFVDRVRAAYADVKRLKPDATRGNSVEFFVVAKGLRPT